MRGGGVAGDEARGRSRGGGVPGDEARGIRRNHIYPGIHAGIFWLGVEMKFKRLHCVFPPLYSFETLLGLSLEDLLGGGGGGGGGTSPLSFCMKH